MRAATDQLFAKLLVLGAMPGELEKAEAVVFSRGLEDG